MANKNILITGGTGYVGSHIILTLLKKKYKVIVIDNLTNIKKTIIKQDEDGIPCVSSFKVTNNQNYFLHGDLIYQGDVEIDMRFSGKVEKTKTIRKSIDLDIHK